MRTLIRVRIPVDHGNHGVKDGSLPKTIENFIRDFKAEASYFFSDGGERTGLFVIDLKNSSDLPFVSERFFLGFNASVEAFPVMNAEDLRAGIERIQKSL